MASITETCICGATMTYEGVGPRSAADEFRKAHAICREAASKPTVRAVSTQRIKLPDVDKLTGY